VQELSIFLRCLVINHTDEDIGTGLAYLGEGEAYRRETGRVVFTEFAVVKAHNGYVIGNRQTHLLRRAYRTYRHEVVHGEYRAGRLGQREQTGGYFLAAGILPVAVLEIFLGEGNVSLAQGISEALHALFCLDGIAQTAYDSNPAVSHIYQMPCSIVCAVLVVIAYRDTALAAGAAIGENERHVDVALYECAYIAYVSTDIYDAIHLLHDLYNIQCPVYITENGTYFEGTEPVGKDGMVHDDDRIRYVSGFLEWLEKAIDEGFDIRGYYLWSLMDNFEWSAAYNFKFGIMHTDFATGKTTWKKSAYFYRDFIRNARYS